MNLSSSFEVKPGYSLLPCGFFEVTGEKAAQLLHGQLTNSIKDLEDGSGNYNLLLTTKGKIISDLHVFHLENVFYCLVNSAFTNLVEEHLLKLAPLSRVTILNETSHSRAYHLIIQEGSSLHALIGSLKINQADRLSLRQTDAIAFRSDRYGVPGIDLIVASDQEDYLLAFFHENNLQKLDQNEIEEARIAHGICKIGVDANNENLPQEARLDGTLHFTKGCYLGQEIIARLHYKGHVNKLLVIFKIEGRESVAEGTKIYDDDKEAGRITSSIFSPLLKAVVALGYVPYKSAEPGKTFTVGESRTPAHISS